MPGSTGIIADIQRCSVHDGPGIRTTVFMKGCNLRCAWCHNPETIDHKPEFIFNPEKCISCGMCSEGCYSGARILCGRELNVEEVLSEILLDQPYYGREGGLTLSGGEPLLQQQFCGDLISEAKKRGVKCGIESNLTLPWSRIEQTVTKCDLIMADLKIWNEKNHKKWTGGGNRTIINNMKRLSDKGIPLIIRTPLVPGVNALQNEISSIALFASTLKSLLYYELLPYHPLGQSKQLHESAFKPVKFEQPGLSLVGELVSCARSYGIPVRVAGVQK